MIRVLSQRTACRGGGGGNPKEAIVEGASPNQCAFPAHDMQ